VGVVVVIGEDSDFGWSDGVRFGEDGGDVG